MQKITNYARGYIRFEAVGPYPERFLNLCAENGIEFWRVERVDAATLRLTVRWHSRKRLASLAEAAGFSVKDIKNAGGPAVWLRLRSRVGLIAGAAFFAALVYFMSFFVWDIEIVGNTSVPSEEILINLQELGVGLGTSARAIKSERIKDEMLLRVDKLSWLAVNVSGSRAVIEVRERVESEQPIVDKSIPCDIVASRPGVIYEMNVLAGQKHIEVGQSVNTGDILVGGRVDNRQGVTRLVRSMAMIKARTWHELTACMPLTYSGKSYTGKSVKRYGMIVGNALTGLEIGGRVSFAYYDKTREERQLTLPPGVAFPVTLVFEEYIEYKPVPSRVDENVARAALERRLIEQLTQASAGGLIIQKDIVYEIKDGLLYAALTAECLEDIGVETPVRLEYEGA